MTICFRLNTAEEAAMPGGNSLFVCEITDDQAIQRMIDHSRDIAHWVAAEIVGCSSSKVMGILESSKVMGILDSSKVMGIVESSKVMGILESSKVMGILESSKVMATR